MSVALLLAVECPSRGHCEDNTSYSAFRCACMTCFRSMLSCKDSFTSISWVVAAPFAHGEAIVALVLAPVVMMQVKKNRTVNTTAPRSPETHLWSEIKRDSAVHPSTQARQSPHETTCKFYFYLIFTLLHTSINVSPLDLHDPPPQSSSRSYSLPHQLDRSPDFSRVSW